jgi:hypothetical protein
MTQRRCAVLIVEDDGELQKPFEIEKVADVIANLHEPHRELSPSAT